MTKSLSTDMVTHLNQFSGWMGCPPKDAANSCSRRIGEHGAGKSPHRVVFGWRAWWPFSCRHRSSNSHELPPAVELVIIRRLALRC